MFEQAAHQKLEAVLESVKVSESCAVPHEELEKLSVIVNVKVKTSRLGLSSTKTSS